MPTTELHTAHDEETFAWYDVADSDERVVGCGKRVGRPRKAGRQSREETSRGNLRGRCIRSAIGAESHVHSLQGRFPTRSAMITLYFANTPNGRKVRLFLEEVGEKYVLHEVDLGKGRAVRSPIHTNFSQQQDSGDSRLDPWSVCRAETPARSTRQAFPGVFPMRRRSASPCSSRARFCSIWERNTVASWGKTRKKNTR